MKRNPGDTGQHEDLGLSLRLRATAGDLRGSVASQPS